MEKQDLDRDSVPPSGRTVKGGSVCKGLQNVPLKVLDLFIGLCTAALVIIIAVGVLNR